MKEKYILIAIIDFLTLDKNSTFNLFNWQITNDRKIISENIPNKTELTKKCGTFSTEELLLKTVAFKICESDDLPHSIIHKESENISAFLSLIWTREDNSIGTYSQIIQTIDGKKTYANRKDSFKTNSEGKFDDFHLTANLINIIKNEETLIYFENLLLKGENKNLNVLNKSHRTELENSFTKTTRIQRSFILLQIARSNSFLPMKIAFYINVLECLLLDNDAELSLRLQLYSATLIGKNKEEKTFIRNVVNKAYGVRSQFFHGSIIKLKKDKLENLSKQLDNIVRDVIIKSIKIKDIINTTDTNIRNDYFKSIFFN